MPKKSIGRLAIIVGHEAKAQGAVAAPPLSMSEYSYNTLVAEDMEAYAKGTGLETKIFFRDGLGITRVGKAASTWCAGHCYSRCIELHFNAASPAASGTETLYDTREQGNEGFARAIQKQLVALFGAPDRGAKKVDEGRGSANLKAVTAISCLVEPLFGSNKSDSLKLLTKRIEYAKCLVDTVIAEIKK